MRQVNIRWQKGVIKLLFIILMVFMGNAIASPYIKVDTREAIKSLLTDAKAYYEEKEFEQAAASLERALRIDPRNPILWHNLAGSRLAQEDWKRAANLAQKSNALAGSDKRYKRLRIRNWVVITLACEGMSDTVCTREARNRAQALARTLSRR